MAWPTTPELDDLVLRFQERTLPKSEWTHLAHLAVGMWHVQRYGAHEAVDRLRTGIRCLNDAHGTPNTDGHGYHETITRAYALLIAEYLSSCEPGAPLAEHAQALIASPLAGREALLAYYSRKVLVSVEARRQWVEPDRHVLRLPIPAAS
jgi:hypothetical protein